MPHKMSPHGFYSARLGRRIPRRHRRSLRRPVALVPPIVFVADACNAPPAQDTAVDAQIAAPSPIFAADESTQKAHSDDCGTPPAQPGCTGYTLRLLGFVALLAVQTAGCQRGRNPTLRVPPPPSFFDTSAIRVEAFMDDLSVRRHILAMPFGEAAARLKSLHFEARTQFAFNQGAGSGYEQSDRASVHYDLNGNLHVTSVTPMAKVELLTADDRVFVRYDTGQLRQKTRRDMDIDELPERAYIGASQVLDLFVHLTYVDPHADTVGGRTVTRYALRNASTPTALRPPAAVARTGIRLPAAPPGRWRDEIKTLDLAGTLAVDDATGVVLEADIDGRLEIRDPAVKLTVLTIHHSHRVTEAGRASNVRAPAHSIAEFRRPLRPRDPLAFFRDQLPGSFPALAPSGAKDSDEAAQARPSAPPPAPEE